MHALKFYFFLFCRSHQKLLVDTATTELIFLTEFFLNAGKTKPLLQQQHLLLLLHVLLLQQQHQQQQQQLMLQKKHI